MTADVLKLTWVAPEMLARSVTQLVTVQVPELNEEKPNTTQPLMICVPPVDFRAGFVPVETLTIVQFSIVVPVALILIVPPVELV